MITHASDFPPLSTLLARLTPRIVDSLSAVRHLAIEAVWLSFQLTFLHKGQATQNGGEEDMIGDGGDDTTLFNLQQFKAIHLGFDGKLEPSKGREAIIEISKQIECHLPQSQLQTYISALFKMLNDKQNNVSTAVALLLSIVLKDRGRLLNSEAEIIISTILEHLPLVHSITQTYADLLNALTYFSDEQLNIVVEILLKQPLPYSPEIIDSWKSLSKNSYQFSGACDQILDSLNCLSAAVENGSGGSGDKAYLSHYEIVDLSGGVIVKLVKPLICSNFAALTQLLNGVEDDEELKKRIPQILYTIFHNLSSVIDSQYPSANPMPPLSSISPSSPGNTSSSTTTSTTSTSDGTSSMIKKKRDPFVITAELKRISPSPAALIAESLKTLLQRIKAENVIEAMNGERAWTQLIQSDSYISAIGVACRSLCDYYPGYMRSLMLLSMGNVQSPCNYLRISSAAILSALITRCPGGENNGQFDETILDKVVEELKHFVKDKHLLVRKTKPHYFRML
uniref:RNA polymerase II assembly factor Rtp1 C-terminal domain-containing protein n=1 Tax=Panagrolaimus superbus TaxID=310955 RepID=A0A914YTH9_9BILA